MACQISNSLSDVAADSDTVEKQSWYVDIEIYLAADFKRWAIWSLYKNRNCMVQEKKMTMIQQAKPYIDPIFNSSRLRIWQARLWKIHRIGSPGQIRVITISRKLARLMAPEFSEQLNRAIKLQWSGRHWNHNENVEVLLLTRSMGFAGMKIKPTRAYWKSVDAVAGTIQALRAWKLNGHILGAPYFKYTCKESFAYTGGAIMSGSFLQIYSSCTRIFQAFPPLGP